MNSSISSGLSPPQRLHGNEQDLSTQFSLKKIIPIKRNDAEMLSRQDIQFDLLDAIFSDQTKVFTDQTPGSASNKITFGELYINALYQSQKCSKVLKDKMKETPAFALELAKISLLANVGRINTTMAFFPEMKTALRTYHPVPSLQKTDGNLQDAPRIKNCLKAALLPSEPKDSPPSSLADVLEKLRLGARPPTSIVNLIFVMASQTTLLARTHFDAPLDFLDLFMPVNIPSLQRAKAFLWLVYHYLEDPTSTPPSGPSTNPFSDDYARSYPGKVPWLPRLSAEEMRRRKENVDPQEEIDWGNHMCAQRTAFLQKLTSTEKKNKNVFRPPQILELAPRRPRAARQVYQGDDAEGFKHYTPQAPIRSTYTIDETSRMFNPSSLPSIEESTTMRRPPRPVTQDISPTNTGPPRRSMFQHAFHIVSTTDPLADSDEEFDEHVRIDYDRRLQVLSRLRAKSPTPPRRSPNDRREFSRHRWDPYTKNRRRSRLR